MDTTIVSVKDISFYHAQNVVFEKFSFAIKSNQKVAITGSSGRGKTTLLNLLLGFQVPGLGVIELFGEPLNKLTLHKARARMSYLPQNFTSDTNTVKELFYLPYTFKVNKQGTPSKEKIQALFHAFQLNEELLHRNIFEVSVGQMQRVMLASVFLLGKPMMILDEPTAPLDKDNARLVFDYMQKLPQTIICTSHDPDWLDKVDLIVHLD